MENDYQSNPIPQNTQTFNQPAQQSNYVSNPFLVSTDGLIEILQVNAVPALLAMVLMILGFIGVTILGGILGSITPVLSVIVLLASIFVLFPAVVGMFYVIAGASAKDEKVTLQEAFSKSLSRLLPFIGLSIISTLAIVLGLILLVVPGLYVIGRIALAPIVFFEEEIGPIDAIKRSLELTQGHALEVLSALLAGSLLTGGGLLTFAASIAPLVGRYRGLDELKKANAPKPKIHWLNFLLPVLIGLFLVLYGGLLAYSFSQAGKNVPAQTESQYDFSDKEIQIDPQQFNTDPNSLDSYYNQ